MTRARKYGIMEERRNEMLETLKNILCYTGVFIYAAGAWSIIGLVFWWCLLSSGLIGLRSGPKLYALGGAVFGVVLGLSKLGED